MKSIFISSTFRDMQQERDVLAMDVLPEIAGLGREYGESVSFIDLRWGVDTSELESAEGARKVLSVCLDEIEKCNPYMIILLGERYGWVPERILLADAAGGKGHLVDDDFKSVTALEIEYGALSEKGQLDHCLFYMREPLPLDKMNPEAKAVFGPESEKHREKQLALKQKISEQTGKPIKVYRTGWDLENNRLTGLDTFAAMVLDDLKALLASEWQESALLPPQERERRDSWHIFENAAARFAAMLPVCRGYEEDILAEDTRLFVLKGREGSGKSFFLSKMAVDFREQGFLVMPFICGSSPYSSNALALMTQAVNFLETVTGAKPAKESEEESSFKEVRDRFSLLVAEYARRSDTPLLFIIDGLESLGGEDALNFNWLPDLLPEKVRFVVSCLEGVDLKLPILFTRGTVTAKIPPLPETERLLLINGLTAASHKELHTSVISRLLGLPQADDPLYLSMLIERMLLFNSEDFGEIARRGDTMAAINEYLCEIIDTAPRDVNGLCISVIAEAGSRINKKLTDHTLRFLSLSRFGLRGEDIKNILEAKGVSFNALDFSRLVKYMRPYLTERPDGRIDFAHQNIRNGIIRAMQQQNYKSDSLAYMRYLKTLPVSDPLSSDDIILHAWRCGDEEALVNHTALLDEKTMPAAFISAALQIKIIARTSPEWLCCAVEDFAHTPAGQSFMANLSGGISLSFDDTQAEQEALGIILEELSKQLERQYRANGAGLLELIKLQSRLAKIYKAGGRYDAARELLIKGAHELSSLPDSPPAATSLLASCHQELSVIYKSQGNYPAMQTSIGQAVALREKLAQAADRLIYLKELAGAIEQLANIDNYMGRLKEQLAHSLQGAELRRRILEREPSLLNKRKLATSYAFAVMAFSAVGRLDESASYARQVVEIRESLAQELRTPIMLQELALAYNDLAAVSLELSCFEEARECLETAGPIFEKLLESQGTSRSKIDAANYYNNYSHYYSDQQILAPALEWMHKAAQMRKEAAEELGTAGAREQYEAILLYIKKLEDNLAKDPAASPPPRLSPAQKLMNQAAVAMNAGQQIMDTDPNTARWKFEMGIEIAAGAIELDPGHRNRNFLAYGYYLLASLLKDEPHYQAQCWKKCSDIWIDLYEKAPDKAIRNLYKESYGNAKKLKIMARRAGVK